MSSMTRASATSAASASRQTASRWSVYSCVPPTGSAPPTPAARVDVARSTQPGACSRSVASIAGPSGPRQRPASASSTGMYGSPPPYCSTHWPHASRSRPSGARRSSRSASSTSVVLPIPASPVTKPTWRLPLIAAPIHASSWARSEPRPTTTASGSPAGAMADPAVSPMVATKRYPRRGTVSMNRGADRASPNTARSSPIDRRTTSSVTATSPQTASSSACFVISSPGCSAKCTRTEKVFGRSATRVPARRSCPAGRSRSNGENRMCFAGVGKEAVMPTRPARYPVRGRVASATQQVSTRNVLALSRPIPAPTRFATIERPSVLVIVCRAVYPSGAAASIRLAQRRQLFAWWPGALLARAISICGLGGRRKLVAGGAAPRFLRALPETRAVVDAEAPEVSEAALHRHQRDARCRIARAAQEALACFLEAPRAQELHRRAAAPATEARLDGSHAHARKCREIGESDRLQSVAREVVRDLAQVARLRGDGARMELLRMAAREPQEHVEQEPFEPPVGDDRGARPGAALVQLGDEEIEKAHRVGAESGGDREALVEEERRATRNAEQRGERCLHRGALDLHLHALKPRLQTGCWRH